MAFSPVTPSVKFPELDEALLRFWEEERVFEKTVEGREDREPFVSQSASFNSTLQHGFRM